MSCIVILTQYLIFSFIKKNNYKYFVVLLHLSIFYTNKKIKQSLHVISNNLIYWQQFKLKLSFESKFINHYYMNLTLF